MFNIFTMKETVFKNIKRLFLAIIIMSTYAPASAGNIYVSPSGNDTNEGTIDKPLMTIHAALQKAREWRRLGDPGIKSGINIFLNEGMYFMEEPLYIRPEDSGTKESPTIITSNKGKAVITGGKKVSGWQKEGLLWVADAPTKTIRQLWTNNRRAIRASLFGEDIMERMIDFDKDNRTITIPTPKDIHLLMDEEQMEMTVHQRWATAILRIKSMTPDGDKTVVRFKEPESRIEFSHPWPQPVINGEMGSSSYSLHNSKLFLDEPGEWFHDEKQGKLYYYPREGETLDNTEIFIPVKEKLVEIEGCSADMVSYIEISNIAFMYAAWNRPAHYGHVTLQAGFPITDAYKLQTPGLPWAASLENQAWVARPVSAVSVRYAKNITFNKCLFEHLASTALDYAEGVSHSKIENSQFRNIGGTAIMAGSFAEGPTEVHRPYIYANDTLKYCHNISIKGNTVVNATCEDWGAMGIGCGYVRDTKISHNIVDGVNWSGICIGWGWTPLDCGMRNNHITDNTVVNFAMQMHDSGAIYTMSAQPGSTIMNNHIDKMGKAPYATNERAFYIYLDAETDGYTIDNNYCPELKFGDNNPGPNIKWGKNGENVVKD